MDDSGETAFLAGGCAWIMQPLLSQPEGVISTRTGWMGGHGQNPTEENDGGHAETIEVVFDPARLSFRGLLEVFFQVHEPTSLKILSAPSIAPSSSTRARSSSRSPRR